MEFLNRHAAPHTLSIALDAVEVAFDRYESADTCWRLARSLRDAAVDKGATRLALEDYAQDVENARVALLVARNELDDALRDQIAVRRHTRAANDQAAE
jgi:hypothetical protein